LSIVSADSARQGDNSLQWYLKFEDLQPDQIYILSVKDTYLFNIKGEPLQTHVVTNYSTIPSTCYGHGIYRHHSCFCNTGYTGLACEDCDVGFYSPLKDGNCSYQGTEVCKDSTCHNNGDCDDTTGRVICTCHTGHIGDRCEACPDGLYDSRGTCVQGTSCDLCPSSRGSCDFRTGLCQCKPNFAGTSCEQCSPGYTGENCSQKDGWPETLGYIKIAGMVFGGIIITCSIILAIWRYRRNNRTTTKRGSDYYPVELDDDATELDSNILADETVLDAGFELTTNTHDDDDDDDVSPGTQQLLDLDIELALGSTTPKQTSTSTSTTKTKTTSTDPFQVDNNDHDDFDPRKN